ncbi:hypothetical protein QFC22_000068 [Naganishia vaughanmartiniae]|uniref:Uncharacterized protein n=1 Tax=Naganishia vaughanmartiniae TaxID=1424756 RepID=A0ACC2XP16_9TREE|nr:hypothetical protein QFC22_000068 [Naganishia vaughanmartiniae]
MSSRRSERSRKRPLSIDTQYAPPSLTSLAASFQKPVETKLGETAVNGLAGEDDMNGSIDTSMSIPNKPHIRAKGGSVRSRAATRTRLAAASPSFNGNQENEDETIQQHEQYHGEVVYHQQGVNGEQSHANDEPDAAELQEESQKDDDEEEEDPVWQEFSQEYYEVYPVLILRALVVVEQLPLEIHRNFALLRELDDQTQRQTGQLLEIIRKYVAQRLPLPVPERLQDPLPILQSDTATPNTVTAPCQEGEAVAQDEHTSTGNGGPAPQANAQPMDADAMHQDPRAEDEKSGEASTIQTPDVNLHQTQKGPGSEEKSETLKSQPVREVEQASLSGDQHGTEGDCREAPLDRKESPEASMDAGTVMGDAASATSIPVLASGDVPPAIPDSTTNGTHAKPNGIDNHSTESVPPTATVDQQPTSIDANPPPTPPPTNGTHQMQLLKTRHAQMYAHDLVPAMASRALLPEIGKLAREMLRSADEKVGIAMGTYNTVDRHIRSLDAALQAQQAALNLGIRQDTLPSTAITGATITGDDSEPPTESMLQAGGRADAGDLVLGASGNAGPDQAVKRVGKNWRKGIKGSGHAARAADALNIGVSSSALHHPNSTTAQADAEGGASGTAAMSSRQRGKQKAEPEPIVLGYMAAHKFDMKIDPNEPRYWWVSCLLVGVM